MIFSKLLSATVFVFFYLCFIPYTSAEIENSFFFINDTVRNKDTLPSFIGISYMPSVSWKVFTINTSDGNYMRYYFDQNAQTSIEGNKQFSKFRSGIGLSAQIDNNQINKIYQYSGYLRIRNIWLYLQSSTISGYFTWTGPLAGFAPIKKFNSKFFTIDIRKTMRPPSNSQNDYYMGWYWGIGYTLLGLPIKITTTVTPGGRENQEYGLPAYDSMFTAKVFTIFFGWDLLRQNCLTKGMQGPSPGVKPKKFAMYASTQDKIGFGTGKHSENAILMAEALNPGKTAVIKNFTTIIDYYLSVGFRYSVKLKPLYLVFATGYDIQGGALFHGSAADTDKDLGLDISSFYFFHGVSFKLFMSF